VFKKVPIKVILDTNLFVASYFNPYSCSSRIIDWCLENKIKNCITKDTFNELEFILKKIRATLVYKKKIYNLMEKSILVKPGKVFLIKDDWADNKFLSLADKSQADYLITNDYHLLKLKKFKQTRILKPTEFYHLIKNKLRTHESEGKKEKK